MKYLHKMASLTYFFRIFDLKYFIQYDKHHILKRLLEHPMGLKMRMIRGDDKNSPLVESIRAYWVT